MFRGYFQRSLILQVLVLSTFSALARASEDSQRSVKNPVGWKDLNPAQFGCLIETNFGYRDKRFNCSTKEYKFAGYKPCTPQYAEHPDFPVSAAKRIHPKISYVAMDWAAGQFLGVTFGFPVGTMSPWEILEAFDLPKDYSDSKAQADGITFYFSKAHKAKEQRVSFRFNRGEPPECNDVD